MHRFITAILFLIAFAAQCFQQTVVIADYYLNTTAYAKNCINRAKPVMKCKGKCQMMKKLQEEEEKNQQLPERKLENKNEVASSRSFYPSLPAFAFTVEPSFSAFQTAQEVRMPRQLLRPPIC